MKIENKILNVKQEIKVQNNKLEALDKVYHAIFKLAEDNSDHGMKNALLDLCGDSASEANIVRTKIFKEKRKLEKLLIKQQK